MEPYDDDTYHRWYEEFQRMVQRYLNVEGNTTDTLQDEFDNAVENAEVG